jgi:DNA-binding XRE family transcriptional regulator
MITKNNLKQTRTERAMSQLDLAKITDIAPSIISQIENGKIFPYDGWKERIALALDIDQDAIFPRSDYFESKAVSE